MDALLSYYGALAGVAGGLFALMFTAIQVRESHWVEGDPLRKVWATAALFELLVVLMTTLIVLMPSHLWHVGPVIGGLGGMLAVRWQRRRFNEAEDAAAKANPADPAKPAAPGDFDRLQLRLTWVSVFVYGWLIICGLAPVWARDGWTILGASVLDLGAIHGPSALLTWLIFSGSAEVVFVLMYSDEY